MLGRICKSNKYLATQKEKFYTLELLCEERHTRLRKDRVRDIITENKNKVLVTLILSKYIPAEFFTKYSLYIFN